MSQTRTIDDPGLGYFLDDEGAIIGKFDVEPGDHQVADAVAEVVYVDSPADLRGITPARTAPARGRPDWQQRWQDAASVEDKLQVIEERFF